jgi:hypothetical protein
MLKQDEMIKVFQPAFTPPQATLLARVITEAYTDLVKTSDFNELKAIVAELAAAQQRTEQRMGELAAAQQRTEQRMDELATAQQRTEQRMGELAAAQQRTEQRMGELAAAQQRTEQAVQTLARGLKDTRAEVGGLSRSFSYALENEAYRTLPAFLASRYGIQLTDRFVRTELDGEEINFFGHATQNGENVIIVGEVKLRLDDRRKVETEAGVVLRSAALVELERKLAVVRRHHPGIPLVPLLVTHYARPTILQEATEQGVTVVQSFEW